MFESLKSRPNSSHAFSLFGISLTAADNPGESRGVSSRFDAKKKWEGSPEMGNPQEIRFEAINAVEILPHCHRSLCFLFGELESSIVAEIVPGKV